MNDENQSNEESTELPEQEATAESISTDDVGSLEDLIESGGLPEAETVSEAIEEARPDAPDPDEPVDPEPLPMTEPNRKAAIQKNMRMNESRKNAGKG